LIKSSLNNHIERHGMEVEAYQDIGVEGTQVEGAVAVDLEPDARVDAVEERTE
jgi:hypothetical protein